MRSASHFQPAVRTKIIFARLVCLAFLVTLLGFPDQSNAQDNPIEQSVDLHLKSFQEDATFHDVVFVGPQFGYVVGDHGVIRKTEDGGITWERLESPVSSCSWQSACFLTPQIGWIAGGSVGINGGTTHGVIAHTRDGGKTWNTVSPSGIGMLFHVQFFDLEAGIICGESTSSGVSGVWQTSNGGKFWQVADSSEKSDWRCASFTASGAGVVAGNRGSVAMLGGNKLLQDRSHNFGLRGIHDLTLTRSGQGWLVGDGGLLRYSPARASWQDPPTDLPVEINSLYDFKAVAVKENSVWVAGHPGSAIWYSHDEGKTWNYSPTGVTVPIHALHFADTQTGWAVGELGTILKTEDGGRSWKNLSRQSRRLALLQITTGTKKTSLCLTSRYGGHYGYRVGTLNYCSREQEAGSRLLASDDLRQHQAVIQTGGNHSSIGWALPIDIPGLSQNQELLIKRWNQATDGQLSEVVLSHLVRDLRTFRPSVVVIDSPAPGDEAQILFRKAVHHAIRSAEDPTWMVAQKQYAFLPPWKVSRLFERSGNGQGGDILLDASQYLPGINQSVRMAASPGHQLIHGNIIQLPLTESFTLSDVTPLEGQFQLTDLFTGIILGPGSEARRGLVTFTHPDQARATLIAKKQRNYAAYSRTRFSNEGQASQMIAQLDDVISGSPPRQAVTQLLEIAEQYRVNSKWDYYETVLMQIMDSFPEESLSSTAAVKLLHLWSSEERNFQRLKVRNTGSRKQSIDPKQTQKQYDKIRQVNQEYPDAVPTTNIPAIRLSGVNSLPKTPGSEQDRASWKTTWQERSISAYQYLKKKSPELAKSPEVQLPWAALMRSRGAIREADGVYGQYLIKNGKTALHQIATAEFYLRSGTGLPPARYTVCKRAEAPPYLDGLLSEPCWQSATEIYLDNEQGPDHRNGKAMVMLSYDQEYLYVAASCPKHPQISYRQTHRGARKHDAILENYDRLQFCFDINRDYHSYYRFEVDQRGLTSDKCLDNSDWDPKWHVASEANQTHWRVEIAIPLEEFGGADYLIPEQAWAISLSRIIPGVMVQSWGNQKRETPHYSSMGVLHFK